MAAIPRIGFQVWGQTNSWAALAHAATGVERLGFDSLWSNDHFYPAAGTAAAGPEGQRGPMLEGWMTAAGFAMLTQRIPVGVLVSGAAYRNVGLVVKMATALDHLSGGRASLGLGAGWHIAEHRAFGFELGSVPERLDRLDEQSAAVRALLDTSAVTRQGRWVRLESARNDPAPLGRLPLMIGGSGERRTLRIVARDADAWNGEGDVATFRHKSAVLDAHCHELGRDPATIRRTVGLPPPCLRPTRSAAIDALAAMLRRSGLEPADARAVAESDPFAGPASAVLGRLGEYAAAGADEAIFDLPTPVDDETLEGLADLASASA
jgi:alkanesulfonate monooxygenase SsuD/methylene tetrahydromethanopterin reductase-like flavin-dependent oxidoreductase (luciferase family)